MNRKEDLLNGRDQITGIESVTRTRESNRQKKGKTREGETCPAPIPAHRPRENEKERTIVGGTSCVTSGANIFVLRRVLSLLERGLFRWGVSWDTSVVDIDGVAGTAHWEIWPLMSIRDCESESSSRVSLFSLSTTVEQLRCSRWR